MGRSGEFRAEDSGVDRTDVSVSAREESARRVRSLTMEG